MSCLKNEPQPCEAEPSNLNRNISLLRRRPLLVQVKKAGEDFVVGKLARAPVVALAVGFGDGFVQGLVSVVEPQSQRMRELHLVIGASNIETHGIIKCLHSGAVGASSDSNRCALWRGWRAPIGWSSLIVSASSASDPSERCFLARVGDSPMRCGA